MDWIEQAKEMLISYAPLVAGAILTLVIGFILAGIISRMARKAMEKEILTPASPPFHHFADQHHHQDPGPVKCCLHVRL